MSKSHLEPLIPTGGCHLTFSQRRLAEEMLNDILLRESLTAEDFAAEAGLRRLLRKAAGPVERGRALYEAIRLRRYPRSGGKPEVLPCMESSSTGVRHLNSKVRLINPYFYGEEIFNLKEHVLSLIRSCPLDCAYCFLREIYDSPRFKIEPDYARIERELSALRGSLSGPIYLNAGENADSLIQDAEFGLCGKVWGIAKSVPDVFLEFRSKTDKIQNVLKIQNPGERLVLAFSLNPEEDRRLFESTTAPIAKRISAASSLASAGFSIGLRLEPVVYTKDLASKYKRMLDEFFSRVPAGRVHSVSLGCLRLTKGLAKMLKKTHPRVMAEEWVLGKDKKFKYYAGLRAEIYASLLKILAPYYPQERTILSTEPALVWRESGLPLKTLPEICLTSRTVRTS